MNAEEIATRIYRNAFENPRQRRSDEYIRGVLDTLLYRLGENLHLDCPYPEGTAQADAWYSGNEEGHALYRKHQEMEATP